MQNQIEKANELYNTKNYQEALACYTHLLELKPDDEQALYMCAHTHVHLNQYSDAITAFEKAIRLKPKDLEVHYQYATGLYNMKLYQDALARYIFSLELKSDDERALYMCAHTHVHLNQYSDAITAFEKAIRLKPKDPEVHYQYATGLYNMKLYQDALARYTFSLELKSDDVRALYMRARTYVRLNQYSDAIVDFENATRLKPNDPYVHYQYAAGLYAMGEYKHCILLCQEILNKNPNHADTLNLIKQAKEKTILQPQTEAKKVENDMLIFLMDLENKRIKLDSIANHKFIDLAGKFVEENEKGSDRDPKETAVYIKGLADAYQYSYFIVSIFAGNYEAVAYLVSHGVNINQMAGIYKQTGLMIAALFGRYEIARFLICDVKANVNAQDAEGSTALHMCACGGTLDCAHIAVLLLENGCDPFLKAQNRDYPGETFVDIALNQASKNERRYNQFFTVIIKYFEKSNNTANVLYAKTKSYMEKKLPSLNQQLFEAARAGDVSKINVALDEGAEIEAIEPVIKNEDAGFRPLHLAVISGNIEAVNCLLERGAEIEAKDLKYGCTALHWASMQNRISIVKLLLDRNADVNASDSGGWTPLHQAARNNNNSDTVALLLAKGADINAREKNTDHYTTSFTVLHLAVRYRRLSVVEMLLKCGVDVNARLLADQRKDGATWTSLHIAAMYSGSGSNQHNRNEDYHNGSEMTKLLLDSGANVKDKDNVDYTALHWAARQGHEEVVNLLINAYHDGIHAEADDGSTPLHVAAYFDNKPAIKILLRHGANPQARSLVGQTPEQSAESNGKKSAALYIKTLLIENVKLLDAAKAGNEKEILRALEAEADIEANEIRSDGYKSYTPLLYAAHWGRKSIVEILLKQGANPFVENQAGQNILFLATWNGEAKDINAIEVVKYLAEHQREIFNKQLNTPGGNGQLPLQATGVNNSIETAKFLLQKGADPTLKNKEGINSIEYLYKERKFEVVNAILEEMYNNYRQNKLNTSLLVDISTSTMELENLTLLTITSEQRSSNSIFSLDQTQTTALDTMPSNLMKEEKQAEKPPASEKQVIEQASHKSSDEHTVFQTSLAIKSDAASQQILEQLQHLQQKDQALSAQNKLYALVLYWANVFEEDTKNLTKPEFKLSEPPKSKPALFKEKMDELLKEHKLSYQVLLNQFNFKVEKIGKVVEIEIINVKESKLTIPMVSGIVRSALLPLLNREVKIFKKGITIKTNSEEQANALERFMNNLLVPVEKQKQQTQRLTRIMTV